MKKIIQNFIGGGFLGILVGLPLGAMRNSGVPFFNLVSFFCYTVDIAGCLVGVYEESKTFQKAMTAGATVAGHIGGLWLMS